ncbi:hypothetical protein Ancab_034073 [Ancistrocladus abbreviatus]
MACRSRRLQRRMAFRKKLHTLRTLTNSDSVRASSIIMDAFLYISALKLKLELLKREHMKLMSHIHPSMEVKVQKVGNGFLVKVRGEKRGQDQSLVGILQAFDEIGLAVVQATVSCENHFAMEALVETVGIVALDVKAVTEAVLRALQ